MPASTSIADLNDPTYKAVLGHFQKGEWAPGLAELRGLAERFPHDPDLRAMLEEHQVRANIDLDERLDRRRGVYRAVALWAARVAVVAVLAYGAWLGVQSYSVWFQQ